MRLSFIAAMLMTTTLASADPLAFSVTTHGSTLDLTFVNRSPKPITMTTHVRADLDHYDWLTVRLTGTATRTLHFMESRDKSASIDATLAPGASVTRSVDLAMWAIHADNGDALAAGTYDLEATWDTTSGVGAGPRVKLVATAKLVVPAPIEKSCTDRGAKKGLEILAHQVGKTATVEVGIHNIDKVKHCIVAYIKTHEIQSDLLVLDYAYPTTKDPARRIHLNDDRDKSAPVVVELEPGATAWTRWDVAAWALRARNGKKAVPAGEIVWMDAIFDATSARDTWSGAIHAGFGMRFP